MNKPPRKISETGLYGPVWAEFNRLVDYVREISVTGGRGIKVDRKVTGTFLTAEIPKAGDLGEPGVVKRFKLITIKSDTLLCRELDENNVAIPPDVLIAKPFNLRRSVWHQTTTVYPIEPYPGAVGPASILTEFPTTSSLYRKATITIGGAVIIEQQVVIPRWIEGFSEIVASVSENGTNAFDLTTEAEWIDLNADGRAWSEVYL